MWGSVELEGMQIPLHLQLLEQMNLVHTFGPRKRDRNEDRQGIFCFDNLPHMSVR